MKEIIKIDVPATTSERVVSITCDRCNAEISVEKYIGEIDRVTVKREVGFSYPEGGNHKKYEYDICPKCFDSFIPLFGKPSETEVDW